LGNKGYPLIMPREVYYAVAGLVATERVSMGKIINMLLREALENRGLISKKELTDRENTDKILEHQLTNAFQQWDSLNEKARAWWLKKARRNKHLPIAMEILGHDLREGNSNNVEGSSHTSE
jgi:hypothetical protein